MTKYYRKAPGKTDRSSNKDTDQVNNVNNINDQILKKIRTDGPDNAEIRFFSMEDGGHEFKDVKQFEEYYSRPDFALNWIPERGKRREKIGKKIEWFIPTFMVGYLRQIKGLNFDVLEYRNSIIYSEYEQNIKYYPIGRPNERSFPSWMQDYLRMGPTEYRLICERERKRVFVEFLRQQPVKLNIVVSAEAYAWRPVFKELYPELTEECIGSHERLYWTDKEKTCLAYGYFNINRTDHGSRYAQTEAFCRLILSRSKLA